jgi:uncharacterized protein YdaU (DUF1376 family)
MTPDKIDFDWFPLNWRRFMTGTSNFKNWEVGAYMLLLIRQWEKGFIPDDPAEISEISRTNFSRLSKILKKFQKTETGLKNSFMEQVRAEQTEKSIKKYKSASNAGKASAEARKKKPENPTDVERPLNVSQPLDKIRIDKIRKEGEGPPENFIEHADRLRQETQRWEKFFRALREKYPKAQIAHLEKLLAENDPLILASKPGIDYPGFCQQFGYKIQDLKKLPTLPPTYTDASW